MELIFSLFDNTYVLVGVGPRGCLPFLHQGPLQPPDLDPRLRRGGFDAILGKLLGARYADAKVERAVAREKKRGQLPGRREALRGHRQASASRRGLHRGPGVLRGRRRPREAGEAGARPPRCTCRPATTRRRPRSSPRRASPGKAATLFLEKGNTLEAARLFGVAQDWGRAGRAVRQERLSPARRRGLREDGRVPEGRRVPREALHGERLVLDDLLLDGDLRRTRRARSWPGGSSRRPAT